MLGGHFPARQAITCILSTMTPLPTPGAVLEVARTNDAAVVRLSGDRRALVEGGEQPGAIVGQDGRP
jgi:hypothetical protein